MLTTPDGATSSIWMDDSYRYIELFTGDNVPDQSRQQRSLGVEPMTGPPNAFADDIDVIALDPGQTTNSTWGLRYAPASPPSNNHPRRFLMPTLLARPAGPSAAEVRPTSGGFGRSTSKAAEDVSDALRRQDRRIVPCRP